MFGRNNLPSVPNPFGARGQSPAYQNTPPPPTPPRQQAPYDPRSTGQYNAPRPSHTYDPPQQSRGGPAPGSRPFGIAKVPDETWVIQNVVATNPNDFKAETYLIIDNRFVVTAR